MTNFSKRSLASRIGAMLLSAVLVFTSTGFETYAESTDFVEITEPEEATEIVPEEIEETKPEEELTEETPEEDIQSIEEVETEESSKEQPKEDGLETYEETRQESEKASDDSGNSGENPEEINEENEGVSGNDEEKLFSEDVLLTEEELLAEEALLKEIMLKEKLLLEAVEFEKSEIVDGVKVSVYADPGVFPAESYMVVSKVYGETEAEALDAVEELREADKNVAASYTFDITIYDDEGNEIEPDTSKGSVKVTFEMVELENKNLGVSVYHVEESGSSFEAEELTNIEVDGQELTAETDGFSIYTVEFTYKELQYVLQGYETVDLLTILNAIGIQVNGDIEAANSSNESLFTAYKENGEWFVSAVQAFDSVEKLVVSIGGTEYEIDVTDDNSGGGSGTYAPVQGTNFTVVTLDSKLSFTGALKYSNGAYIAQEKDGKFSCDKKTRAVDGGEFTSVGEKKTFCFPGAYEYFDGEKYDVYVTVTANKTGSGNKPKIEVNTSNSFIQMNVKGSFASYDYEVWLQDSEGNTMSTLALVGGSCYTASSEGARPWSDDGYIYSNIPKSSITWVKDGMSYAPTSEDYNKANFYILGHGFNDKGHIQGGYYSGNGTGGAEIILGYLSRELEIQITGKDPVKIPVSDGYAIGEKGVEGIKKKVKEKYSSTTITGWKSEQELTVDNGNPIPAGQMISDDTLAHVIVKSGLTLSLVSDPAYKVSFDYNYSGKPTDPSPLTVFKNNKYGTLPSASREGYTFDGWYTASSGGSKIESTTTVSLTADTTLFAHWTPIQYTVSFDTKISEVSNPASVTRDYGSKYGTLPTPSRTGYSLEGWYKETGLTNKVSSEDTVTSSITLFAKWTPNQYTVTFNPNGGTVTQTSTTVTYDSTYGDLPVPTRSGYAFAGWYTDETGGTKITKDSPVKITEAQTLYAHWTPIKYTVTFNAKGGYTPTGSKEVTFGETYGALPAPTYVGHAFNGWYNAETSGTQITSDSIVAVADNHTLYAYWTDKNVAVSMTDYDYGTGSVPNPGVNNLTETGTTIKYYYSTSNTNSGGTEWKDITGTTLNAGSYYMYAVITGADGTTYTTQAVPFKVNKVAPSYTPPEPYTLPYTGESQTLAKAGTVTGGTMKYSLTYSETGEGYSASIPTGINAGYYDIYYMVAGDANHTDVIAASPVRAEITKVPCTVTAPVDKANTFTGNPQELVTAAVPTGGTVVYSLDNVTFSAEIPKGTEAKEYTVYYKVIPDANHTAIDVQSVKATISKNARPKPAVTMEDYKYGQKDPIPAPGLESTPAENPTIAYYYYPTGHPEEEQPWDSITSKTLNAGDYCMISKIGQTDNYGPCTTEPKAFKVLKGDYTLTPPTAEYTYGEKIKDHNPSLGTAVAADAEATVIAGVFTWVSSEEEKLPKVSDSKENDGTEYRVLFTPSPEFLVNYDPKNCNSKITVRAKEASPTELNMKLEKVGEDYDVTEKMTGEVDPVLQEGTDYEVTVEPVPNKDKDGNVTDIDYVITYTFKGNYKGTITKRVNMPVPKPNPPEENPESNIIARVDREVDVINEYNPKMEAPDYNWAKKIVLDDFAGKAGTDENSGKIAAKLSDPETEKDIIYDANVVIEVIKPVEGQGEFAADKPIADVFIKEKVKNLGEKIEYIDISMFTTYKLSDKNDPSVVFETDRSRIRDTGDNMEIITIDIPDSIRIYPSNVIREFYIFRVHQGMAEQLDATIANGRITFATSKFSTYAIAYSDTVKPSPAPDPDDDDPAVIPEPPVATANPKKIIAPKTGNTGEASGFMAMLLGGIAVIFSGRKKKKVEQTKY